MLIDLKVWLDHFEYHASRRRALPDKGSEGLTAAERRRIASSIATFQLGEQSEGRSLLRSARCYARTHDAPPIARIVELLIAEEQHHASLLGAFMDQHGFRESAETGPTAFFAARAVWPDWNCSSPCSSRQN